MEYAVELNNLTKKYGQLTAVDNLSLNIPSGSIFGFLGPNGSGKTTTIRIICGVLSPTSGSGRILGYDILKNAEMIKKNIGYMSQKFSLYEDLTVEENLEFYGEIYSIPRKEFKIRKSFIINMAGLSGREKTLAGNLSGGWKQRLALGCALIHRPRLLVLDEPTAGVDPVSRRIFWRIIREATRQNITVLVSTHYMDEARTCDLIGFIFKGKLLDFGPPEEIIKKGQAENLEDIFVKYVEELTGEKVEDIFQSANYLYGLKKEGMSNV